MNQKQYRIILLLNLIVLVIFSVVMILSQNHDTDEKIGGIIVVASLSLCSGIIYVTFANAVKTKDYTLLAGFNNKKNYDYEVLGKMIVKMLNLTLWHTLFYKSILAVIMVFNFALWLIALVVIIYVIDMLVIVIGLNRKYNIRKNSESM